MNKQQVEELLSDSGEKIVCKNCEGVGFYPDGSDCFCCNKDGEEILPVTIGRVLELMRENDAHLVDYWNAAADCKTSKSLNQLIAESGWEYKKDADGWTDFYKVKDNIQRLKYPNVRALVEFISKLKLKG